MPVLRALRDDTEETAAVHELLPSGHRVVVDQVESHHQLRRTYTEFGLPVQLPQGAPGKVLLAFLPWEQQAAVLAGPLEQVTAADHHRSGGAGRAAGRDPGQGLRPVDGRAHAGHPERGRGGLRLLRPGRRLPQPVRPGDCGCRRSGWSQLGEQIVPAAWSVSELLGATADGRDRCTARASAPGAVGRLMSAQPVSLWTIGPSVYLPALLYGIGQGAIAPVVALSARDLGASFAVASLVVAAAGVGQVIGDIPAGALTTTRSASAARCCSPPASSPSRWSPAWSSRPSGVSPSRSARPGWPRAVWGLARQAYLSEAVPLQMRARALSTLGGVQRIGSFVGPFLGAVAMRFLGTDGAYWVHLVAALLACVVLLSLPDVESVRRTRAGPAGGHAVHPHGDPRAPPRTADARHRRAPGRRSPGVAAGGDPALGRAHRAGSADDQSDLRHLRRGRHAALLSGGFRDGPVRPQVGRRTVHARARSGASAAAADAFGWSR